MKKISNLDLYRVKYGIMSKEWYIDEEETELRKRVEDGRELPENVYQDGEDFFKLINPGYSREDIMELLECKQLDLMREQITKIDTIKRCLLFFVILVTIGIFGCFILFSQL